MNDDTRQCRSPAEILLAEDNEYDVMLTRKCFKQLKFAVNMHHVENGEECLAFLRKEGDYADVPTPDLILLDLNMPVMDGREMLAEVKKDNKLKYLPTLVLTTSEDQRDVLAMYELRCNSYIIKPIDFNKFQEMIQNICAYWLTIVVLPLNSD